MKKLLSTLLFLFVIAILSISAQIRISPPTPLEPENGDDGQMPDVILNWAAVAGSGGVVEYEVQLDTSNTFANAVTFPKTDLAGLQMELLSFGQEYFWRVKSIEGTEVSDWSEVFSFIVFETVDLSKPNNNADDQDPDVEFKCKDRIGSTLITGVEQYEFQADTSLNFNSPILFEGASETFRMDASFLHFGETYHWRARVKHSAANSAWSEIRAFIVIPTVELDDPNNGSTDMGLENLLEWEEISGVLDYKFELANDVAFTESFAIILEEPEYLTDGFLTFGEEYFWRVRANHATDTSIYTDPWSFTTTSTVHLSSPEDGAVDVTINPTLEWDMVTGVDFFQIQYNITPSFDEPCCNELVEPTDNFFQVIYILDNSTTYYWRCRTMQGIDTTVWSDVWSFTTRPEDFGINESPFDASNINIYPNPSNGKLFVDITGEENADVSIYVMDLLGQVHIEENVLFGQGNTIRTFDLEGLANGLYIVKLTKGSQTYSYKITIHN